MLWGKECSVHIGACFSGGSRLAPAAARQGEEEARFGLGLGLEQMRRWYGDR